jgi:SAM-dependent methyltransferase
MRRRGAGYGRLSRWYRASELLAFGRDLERARFAHLGRLAERESILLLGEGDGRCVERLSLLAPRARILCVDSSPEMVARARERIAGGPAEGRVQFTCADARSLPHEPGAFDAVVTFFFLDCFDEAGVASIVAQVGRSLRPGALWLFADFVEPGRGLARLRAKAWLALLYAFFRWETGLEQRRLPPSERVLERAGWTGTEAAEFQAGLVRSAVYSRGAAPAPTAARAASGGSATTGNR